jgi:hypothetical protein
VAKAPTNTLPSGSLYGHARTFLTQKWRVYTSQDTCSYSVVGEAASGMGWRVVEEGESGRGVNSGKWNIKWTDRYVFSQTLKDMKLRR